MTNISSLKGSGSKILVEVIVINLLITEVRVFALLPAQQRAEMHVAALIYLFILNISK